MGSAQTGQVFDGANGDDCGIPSGEILDASETHPESVSWGGGATLQVSERELALLVPDDGASVCIVGGGAALYISGEEVAVYIADEGAAT